MTRPELLPRHGPGFVLRRLTTGDLADFQAYRHDEELGRYQGWSPTSDEQARRFLAEMSGAPLPNPGQWIQLGIADPEQQRLIGDIGVFFDQQVTCAEIGFTLARSAQGRGVATAAILAMIELIFEGSTAQRVIGVTDARNLPSMRLLERVGMRITATNQAEFRGEVCIEHTYTVTRRCTIGDVATPERLARAAEILAQGAGTVLLEPGLYLRSNSHEIRCEVLDTSSAAHRCEEEYKVMVENAARSLQRSQLAGLLPDRPLRWVVVEKRDGAVVEVWSD